MKKSITRPPSSWSGFSALARLICGLLFLICVFAFSVEAQTTQTFSYTGGAQTWIVPAGVTSVEVIAKGASGGTGNFGPSPGFGGTVSAVLSVTPGETLHIYVGGAGGVPNGGYNGGGNSAVGGGGGGGATDIRIGGTGLADRVIVAGGGGGSGAAFNGGFGGAGGGLSAGAGNNTILDVTGGGGGTTNTGGTGGTSTSGNGSDGTLGIGGNTGSSNGGGGGGGYYGGGGGATLFMSPFHGSGGGGGSSYTDLMRCTNVVHTQNNNNGNGQLTISYTCPPGGETWTARTAAEANEWGAVTYGNGLFVAVAKTGTNRVMTSSDGITWTAHTAAEANTWRSVTYANGLFVAVSSTGTNRVMTSPDGINWTSRSAAEANQWHSVTYGNGLFVATAIDGANRVMTSPDGITWTARTAAEANQWYAVTYGNGLFVAVALTGTNRVMTSPDGINWTARTAAQANQWIAVTHGNGLFVATANNGTNRVMTSPDGINWTARTSANDGISWFSVTYGNGLFAAVGVPFFDRVMTSPDGITWAAHTTQLSTWASVTYGNGLFVATANNGTNRVMTSPAGIVAAVSIAADPGNSITPGTEVTFTATPTNGGTTPSHQWKVNGSNVGTDQDTYTSTTLADGDVVTCEMTSSDPCAIPALAVSNEIVMTVFEPCAGVSNRIYVTPTGTGNGSSWANATNDLQAAIDNTCGVTEIWMAAGTYKPAGYPTGCTTCTSPRDYAFMLKDNIKIYGGFAGTETMLSERTPGNETILSGDVDNNDTWDSGNAYHILISLNDTGVLLDGLTIQHGYTAETSGWHVIEGEQVFYQDGVVYFKKVNAFTINQVKFVENFGDRYGAGIYVEETGGVCTITNCEFTDNISDLYAGGLYLEYSGENGGYTNIDSCTFTNNDGGRYGGAIYANSEANDTISNCQFIGNTSEEGGALYIAYQESGTATTIESCTFDDNTATDYGGAIYIYEPEGNYIIDSCQFNGNSSDESGGAIYMIYSGYNGDNYTMINGCEFTENYAYYYGGAIYSEESYGNDTISNCQFTSNSCDDAGGAIYFEDPSEGDDNHPTVMDCTFDSNTSSEEGGAIYCDSGEGTQIIRSIFLNNESFYGGAITIYDYEALIADCLLAKNTATSDDADYGAGGAIYSGTDVLILRNCTVADNIATQQIGAGIANDGSELTLLNTILWGNAQQGAGAADQQQVYNDGGTVNISYSLIQDGIPEGATDNSNNIDLDPLFNDPANDDYTLNNCSPAINSGDNGEVFGNYDLAGNTRIQNTTVDMGAYEKATTAVGEIACITFSGFTSCNGDMTYVNEDDFASGTVTVNFSTIPASGTLDLSSAALVGTASVDVSALSGNSYTFNSVKILATGQAVEVTASFSDNSGSASGMLTTPLPCSRYVFTGTGNWDVPANWQDNNQPANSGNNRHFTYLGDAVIYDGMSFSSIGDSVVIEMGGSLDIQKSVFFSKSNDDKGGFENNGTVTLTGDGSATFYMPLYNNGDFTINGGATGLYMSGVDANLFNAGTITNLKKLESFNNITNYPSGVIDNQANIYFSSGVFTNEGEFTHNWPGNNVSWYMGVNNSGIFTVEAGSIDFTQYENAYFTNSGTVTNSGNVLFNFSPTVTNEVTGTFLNSGVVTTYNGMMQNGMFHNEASGVFNFESYSVSTVNNGTIINDGTIEHKYNGFFINNNLLYQNAVLNGLGFSTFENTDSLIVGPSATINITGSNYVFANTATGTFILDGDMTAANQFASAFVNSGILKGTGTLDNSAGKVLTNDATGSIQPGASPGTLTISKLENNGAIEIEIGGNTPGTEHDVLDLSTSSTLDGTLNVTLINGFQPACGDAFDIIMHASNTGTFSTLNLPDGFSAEYLSDKVVLHYGQIGIALDNISDADCANTTCTTDDTFTADVTVSYGAVPGSGTLALTGTTIVGSVAAVNVADLAAGSHTFTGVTFEADGGAIDLTATFSEGCSYSDDEIGTAPECGGEFVPEDITVSGFGCFGPNVTYSFVGYGEDDAPVWVSENDFAIAYLDGEWAILAVEFMGEEFTVWSTNPNGSVDNLPCTGDWTDPTDCALSPGSIALSGGCGSLSGGSGPSCAVTDISLSNAGACNDNGTTDSTDDYFTADVTVTFEYAPEGGTLTLKRGNTILASTTDDLSCTTSHTFENLQIAADGQPVVLSAEFSMDCAYTSGTLMTAPMPCSGFVISGTVVWEDDLATPVPGMVLELSGDATDSQFNAANGSYALAGSGDVTITPEKLTGDPYDGVDVADVTRIQQHVTFIDRFDNGYKAIAADVNQSSSVTGLDAAVLFHAINGNPNAEGIFENPAWRFVEATHTFLDENEPWGFPDTIALTNVMADVMNQDFVGVKMGDVNGTWATPMPDGLLAPVLNWAVPEAALKAGQTLRLPFRANGLPDVAAWQFALRFDTDYLRFERALPTAAFPLKDENFGAWQAERGELRSVFAVPQGLALPKDEVIFELEFQVVRGGLSLSEVLRLDDGILDGRVYNTALSGGGVALSFQAVETRRIASLLPGEHALGFALQQNMPNPFSNETLIRFQLPEAGEAVFSVHDVQGRLLYEQRGFLDAGSHEVRLDGARLGATGVLSYTLRSGAHSATRRMVVVR